MAFLKASSTETPQFARGHALGSSLGCTLPASSSSSSLQAFRLTYHHYEKLLFPLHIAMVDISFTLYLFDLCTINSKHMAGKFLSFFQRIL